MPLRLNPPVLFVPTQAAWHKKLISDCITNASSVSVGSSWGRARNACKLSLLLILSTIVEVAVKHTETLIKKIILAARIKTHPLSTAGCRYDRGNAVNQFADLF